MAVTSSILINESTETATIESFQVTDAEVVDFLSNYDDSEQEKVVAEALSIGVKAMQLMDTS